MPHPGPTHNFSGARARFKITPVGFGPTVVGFAGGVSGEESVDYEPVDVLGLLEVLEHVPVAYRANFNANLFRIVGDSIKTKGIFPKQGAILTSGALTASIEDTVAGRTAYLFSGVKASTRSFDLSARSLVTENLSFVATRVKDESEV